MEDKIFTWFKDHIGKDGKSVISETSLSVFAKILSAKVSEEDNLDEVLAPYVSFFAENISSDFSNNQGINSNKGSNEPGKGVNTDDDLRTIVLELKNKLEKVYEKEEKQSVSEEIKRLMKEKGADNNALIDIAINLADLDYSRPASELAQICHNVYDTKYTELYGDDGFKPGTASGGGGKPSSAFKDTIALIKEEINRERGVEPSQNKNV